MLKILFLSIFMLFMVDSTQMLCFMLMMIWVSLNFSCYSLLMSSFLYNQDLVSYSLMMLSWFLIMLMILAQNQIYFKKTLHFTFIMMSLSLTLTFMVVSSLLFYFFFEWALIPIFTIILGWGYQPERLKAGLSLFFYTLFASLPLLLILLFIIDQGISSNMQMFYILNSSMMKMEKMISMLMLLMAFLVKFPMFFLHLWLPKAHVEAPVSGSMVLAGVLLKLGGYGILRLLTFFNSMLLIMYMSAFALIGGGILGIICLSFSDLKVLIAYSSVVHMSLIISGILMASIWGMEGSMIIMIAHGMCSSGMFAAANLMYERTHSRSFMLNKGYLNFNPSFSPLWFLLIVANFGGPFTYNLLGEILLIINLAQANKILMLAICLLSFFSAAYSLMLYCATQQGQLNSGLSMLQSISTREEILLMSHIWPLLLLAFSPTLI